jgi:hypothetical protein
MQEKLAEYGAMQERVRVEIAVKCVYVCVSYHMLYMCVS